MGKVKFWTGFFKEKIFFKMVMSRQADVGIIVGVEVGVGCLVYLFL